MTARTLLVANGERTKELAQRIHQRLNGICERYMLENNVSEDEAIIVLSFALGIVATTYRSVLNEQFYADCARAFSKGIAANTLSTMQPVGTT